MHCMIQPSENKHKKRKKNSWLFSSEISQGLKKLHSCLLCLPLYNQEQIFIV